MPALFGKKYTQDQLLRRVGHLSQIGGVNFITRENGNGGGVRWLQFRTGTGFSFDVSLDRGMDVGFCDYRGYSLAWIPPTDFKGPWYFDQTDGFGWLRTAMGGLLNTCGLVHIGNPEETDVNQYRFPAIQKEMYGVHDRAAVTPARLIHAGERWEDEQCFLEATGEITQARIYGENLRMVREYQVVLGESRFIIRDTVGNIGYAPTRHQLLYHLNFGFPFVDNNSELVVPLSPDEPVVALAGDLKNGQSFNRFTNPQDDWQFLVYRLSMKADQVESVPVAIINPDMKMGIYLIYHQNQFPVFLMTRLMSPGNYMVCLEPCTNKFGGAQMDADQSRVYLQPGQFRTYETEIGVLENENQISTFLNRVKRIQNRQ